MNEGLCSWCQAIFSGAVNVEHRKGTGERDWVFDKMLKEKQPHHESIIDLKTCGETECMLCAALWLELATNVRNEWLDLDTVYKSHDQPCASTQIFYTIKLGGILSTELAIIIRSATTPDVPDEDTTLVLHLYHPAEHTEISSVKPRGLCETTFTANSMIHVAQWLAECELAHKNCSNVGSKQWLPKRLIYVGANGQSPRLVLSSSLPVDSKYATLSHCWGTIPTLKLTKNCIDEFQRGIPMATIPRTYSDAIAVTKELEVQFIWIDSLCIIQDSPEDWQRECMEMANVYKNGFCNIAALTSIDSHGGCFSKRDPSLLMPLIVQSYWGGFQNILWHWKFLRHLGQIYGEIGDSPVHTRGWVLQERLLSPRNLHFGQHMIYWECRHTVAAENRVPENQSFDSSLFHGAEDIQGYIIKWTRTIEQYSAASLTYSTDKLVAISALAREFQQVIHKKTKSECKYLAGLWSHTLAQQLLWYPTTPSYTERLNHGTPYWSWASLDGKVEYPDWKNNILIKVHKVDVFGSDTFSYVASSVLQVKGWLWAFDHRWSQKDRKSSMNERIGVIILENENIMRVRYAWEDHHINDKTQIYLRYDTNHPPDSPIHDRFILPITLEINYDDYMEDPEEDEKAYGVTIGLIVEKVAEKFRRIGIFMILAPKRSQESFDLSVFKPSEWIKYIGEEGRELGLLRHWKGGSSKGQFWRKSLIDLA